MNINIFNKLTIIKMHIQSLKGNMITSSEEEEWSITMHQESNSNSHAITENERKWLSSLDKIKGSPAICPSGKPKMQKVPKMHWDIESNKRCYEPLVVSIGPFHRGKPHLQPMEKYKELLAIQFAEESSKSSRLVFIDELYKKVKNILPGVKECYAEDFIKGYSDEELTKMMFLDGCFILRYIQCLVTSNYKMLQMKSHDIAFIRRDLFLLENQLPFEVLQELMSCKFKKDKGMEMITTFITSSHAKPPQCHGFFQSIKEFFVEFFELKQDTSLHPESYLCTRKVKKFFAKIFEGEGHSFAKKESLKNYLPAHLLELLRTLLIEPDAFSEGGCYLRGEWCSYRSAMELKKAGIHFRPGKSRRLSDVKFNSSHCSAILTLPPITIDDATKSELLNLVAYEACPDTPDDFGVTSYLCFMDSLIDHAEDVKELRSKGILLNFLGSDQEVADLFNEIARDLVPNPHAFVDVKDKIEKHYNSKGRIWIAEWKNTHFTNPWTISAFIAALFVIALQMTDTALTAVQTYYAIPKKN